MMKRIVLVLLCALAVGGAEARGLLYYYDFDASSNGALVWSGTNKGTGTTEPTFKSVSGTTLGFVSDGALGSTGSFCESNRNALWLGDGSNSLGCNTTSGFTMSMWVKFSTSHNGWTDFFGFRLGGVDYRAEFGAASVDNFNVWYSTSSTTSFTTMGDVAYTPGTWHHLVWVVRNGTNTVGTCTLYKDGVAEQALQISTAGDLQQIHLGPWVRQAGSDRKQWAANTQIDEFAIYDYPATEDQVKWLAKFRPAPATPAPARAMPYCYQFHVVNGSAYGAYAYNSGTGSATAYKWYDTYSNYKWPAAAGSMYAFNNNNKATFRVDGSGTDGLGATSASGFTFTFWLKAPSALSNLWRDFLSFRLGTRYVRLETTASNPITFYAYGANGGSSFTVPATGTWYHYAMAWNQANKQLDVYRDGVSQGSISLSVAPSDSTALLSWAIGSQCWDNNGNTRTTDGTSFWLDELSLFNYTLSTNQIDSLAKGAVPNLPPLGETNLTRTVTTGGFWSGNSAPWTDANDGRLVRWPTLEDVEAQATVTFAAGATLTNDTYVAAQKLTFAAQETSGTAARLTGTASSTFTPETLEIGEGLSLTVPIYALALRGKIVFNANSKIVLDTSAFTGELQVLTCDGITLPEGETDPTKFFGVTDARFRVAVNEAGTVVSLALDEVAATAEWTRGAGTDDMATPGNWCCKNTAGAVLADALPCDVTLIVIPASASCSFIGETPPAYLFVTAESSVALTADCDWRGLGTIRFKPGFALDLKGHTLQFVGSNNAATFTSSVVGGVVAAEIADGATWTNSALALTGNLMLEKRGAGTLVAAKASQSYTGGTRVLAGEVDYAMAANPLGKCSVTNSVEAGAKVDMCGYYNASTCIYSWELAGTLRQTTSGGGLGYSDATRPIARDVILTGDATIEGGGFYFGSPASTPAYLTLNGHTLTFDIASYMGIGAWRDTDAGGTCIYQGTGYPEMLVGCGLTQTRSVVKTALKLKGSYDVGGLQYDAANWYSNVGTPRIKVFGTYTAGDMRPPLLMQSGSYIDLSARTAPLALDGLAPSNLTATVTYTQAGAVMFADNATVTIDLGTPRTYFQNQLLSWETSPANVATLTFFVSGQGTRKAQVRSNGVYMPMGLVILVR